MVHLRCSILFLLLAVTLCGCELLSPPAPPAATIHNAHRGAVSRAAPGGQAKTELSTSIPIRLLIPAIGVNTAIERVEILANGNLATPTRHPWDDVGWYGLGPEPGARGSAVIDGHLDRPGGSPAVFWNLRKLRRGDSVMVIDTQGRMLRFRVLEVSLYQPQAAPLQAIFGNHPGNDLNLITCAGDWIASQHQTTLRLVVYTTLVS
jgi:sortase (surface protein transpeptidase)